MTGPLLIGLLTQFFGVRTGFVTCGALALLFLFVLARSSSLKVVRGEVVATERSLSNTAPTESGRG